MAPIIIAIGIILIAFTNFYRGVPAQCCRIVPEMSWSDSRQQDHKQSDGDKIPSENNSA